MNGGEASAVIDHLKSGLEMTLAHSQDHFAFYIWSDRAQKEAARSHCSSLPLTEHVLSVIF